MTTRLQARNHTMNSMTTAELEFQFQANLAADPFHTETLTRSFSSQVAIYFSYPRSPQVLNAAVFLALKNPANHFPSLDLLL